eukprot:172772-Rhodomonas_salina.5
MSDTQNGDIQAMLQKIKDLESQNNNLASERSELNAQLQATNSKVSKLTEKTKEDMNNKLNTTISTWLEGIDTANETKKKEFRAGLERLVNNTAEDSGIWQVVACASEQHMHSVTELERLRVEKDALQKRLDGGKFANEDSRVGQKRKNDVIDTQQPEVIAENDGMWGDFKLMLEKDNSWCGNAPALTPAVPRV